MTNCFRAEKIEARGLTIQSTGRYMCLTTTTLFGDQTQLLIVLELSVSLSCKCKKDEELSSQR